MVRFGKAAAPNTQEAFLVEATRVNPDWRLERFGASAPFRLSRREPAGR